MSIIWMIIIGLIVGAVAKLIMPGDQGGGIIVTVVLGILARWSLVTSVARSAGTSPARGPASSARSSAP